jgi:hypothetical protein
MTRNLTLVIAAVIVAGVGFGLGVLAQRSLFSRPGAGGARPEPHGKGFDELLVGWKYPGARLVSSSEGAGLHYSVATTRDDMDKVGKHYEELLGILPTAVGSGNTVAGGEETVVAVGSDSLTPGNKPRDVQAALALQRTKDHVVALHMSRSKDEDSTHIVLFFSRR